MGVLGNMPLAIICLFATFAPNSWMLVIMDSGNAFEFRIELLLARLPNTARDSLLFKNSRKVTKFYTISQCYFHVSQCKEFELVSLISHFVPPSITLSLVHGYQRENSCLDSNPLIVYCKVWSRHERRVLSEPNRKTVCYPSTHPATALKSRGEWPLLRRSGDLLIGIP